MKKNYSIFGIIYCILYWLSRFETLRFGLLFSSTINDTQTIDLFVSILTVIFIHKYFSDKFLSKKRKIILKISYPVIIIFAILLEPIFSGFRKFDNALEMCKYTDQCKGETIYYSTEKEYVFVNKFFVSYFTLDNNQWKSDRNLYSDIYYYTKDGYDIYVYPFYDKYFINISIDKDKSIKDLEDNSNENFKLLQLVYNPNYKIYNNYGKIIDNFDDYKLKILGKKIEFNKR